MRRSNSRPAAHEWWAQYFDAQYLREYEPLFSPERDRREVARVMELLGLPAGSRILDVPCGQGRHAHLLGETGFRVDGFDYSRQLLSRARKRGTRPMLHYIRGDMRQLPARWTGQFDAVLNLFTSFGFFADPADDRTVMHEFARVLRHDGTLRGHAASRDGGRSPCRGRDGWVSGDGTMVGQERSCDPLSGVVTVESRWWRKHRLGKRAHRSRLYTATRLAELCADAGLSVEEAYDGWLDRPLRRRSSEMLLVARKRTARRKLPPRARHS